MCFKNNLLLFVILSVLFLSGTKVAFADDGTELLNHADITKLQVNLNYLWVLLAATLVFFMQAGFMCLESGLAKAKNSINVAIKNLADFILATITFWIVGFGFMFGLSDNSLVGMSDFLIDLSVPWRVILFVFQTTFVGTASTVVSGAVAGRTKFSAYLIISVLVSTLIYPIFGHWAWGSLLHGNAASGWLENMGFIDFAGSTVVHSTGGWVALAGCMVIGPRIDKYNNDGSVNEIPPHNMTLAYLGTFILFFGWFGFNCGSTLAVTPRIAGIAINTMLSASFGCLSASVLSWINSPIKRPRGEIIANGLIGGLVGITAGCASVETVGAAIIGLISGCVVFSGMIFIEKYLKIDDVVGAISVHGFCGVWGTIAAGIFITPEQLGDVSRGHQIFVQCTGVVTCFIWTFGTAYVILNIIDKFFGGMRVSKENEVLGLNISEHGARSTLSELTESMQRATQNKDFSDRVKVKVETGSEYSDLCHGFNQMVDAIQKALKQTQQQIKTAEMARKDAETAEKNLVKSRKEYDERIKEIAENLVNMMNEIENTISSIGNAASKVQTDVKALSGKSEDIDAVLASVEKIAFATKLLATNAMIQAAHAGEAGVGFSVVSSQMGEVAQNTREASEIIGKFTQEIKYLLDNVVNSINEQLNEIRDGKERLDFAAKLIRELIPDHTPSSQSVC